MTLNTDLIEKEALGQYNRYLKDPRVPRDVCSDIYLEVVKRLKRERDKGTAKIQGNHLGQLLKFAVRTVFHKQGKEKEEEEILTNVIKKNASLIWCSNKNSEEKEFFNRIAHYLKDWTKKKENYPGYLRIFMLYHCFHLSPEFVETLAPCTNREKEELMEEMELLRKEILEQTNEQLNRKIVLRNINYFKLVKNETKLGSLNIKQYDCDSKEYHEARDKMKQIHKTIENLNYFPSWARIENLTGLSRKSVSYAYQTVSKAIKESFKDDTYWGA
ncbi:MAG: hypothetical protein PQJ59_18020 [Spirochaetales bacterium]|nr:hypothetical protein [Spirochaetales bacterium]